MKLILISTKIELFKVFSHKKYFVLLFLQSIICIFLMLFTSQKSFSILNINTFINLSVDIPSMPYTVLSVLYTIILPMMIVMLSADLFSAEIESITIKSIFLLPIERLKIYISKLLAITLYIFINLLTVCAIMFIFRLFFGGYTNNMMDIIKAYTLTIVPMITLISFNVFITQVIGSATLASFCSLILYILMQSVGFISLKLAAALFTSHFGWYRMFLGSQTNYINILNIFVMNFAYTVLFTILGYILFNKKEL